MKTILVPTDFSDNAANALDYAIGLAQHTQGRILVFHNSDLPVTYSGTNLFSAGDLALGSDPLVPGAALANPELERIYREQLDELTSRLRRQTGGDLPIESRYLWGSLTTNLNDLIRQEKADLVVMGTKGATSFLDRLIGTTTASVLQESHQAVLAIPAAARFKLPQKVAFATDLESEAQVYLPQVLAFASHLGATVTLVHVDPEGRADRQAQEHLLAGLRSRFPDQPLPLVNLEEKNIAAALEAFVRDYPADLLAVGIHERSFMANLFHSSVTEQLAYHTAIPLLALPEKPYYLS
jgi:nucleotide-binding universal stress UspA family protein